MFVWISLSLSLSFSLSLSLSHTRTQRRPRSRVRTHTRMHVSSSLGTIMLMTKYYIFRCRCLKTIPNFNCFSKEVRQRAAIEKHACALKGDLNAYFSLWSANFPLISDNHVTTSFKPKITNCFVILRERTWGVCFVIIPKTCFQKVSV